MTAINAIREEWCSLDMNSVEGSLHQAVCDIKVLLAEIDRLNSDVKLLELFLENTRNDKRELRANLKRAIDSIKLLIGFIPDGWEMPLGYSQVVAQVKEELQKLKGE